MCSFCNCYVYVPLNIGKIVASCSYTVVKLLYMTAVNRYHSCNKLLLKTIQCCHDIEIFLCHMYHGTLCQNNIRTCIMTYNVIYVTLPKVEYNQKI